MPTLYITVAFEEGTRAIDVLNLTTAKICKQKSVDRPFEPGQSGALGHDLDMEPITGSWTVME